MSSRYSPRSGFSFGRQLTLRAAALAGLGLCALFVLHRGKPLRADAPPAATLVSPNGGTVAIGKPYFLWNKEVTATEYRLKVDNSSSVTVIDSWYLSTAVCSGSTCGATAPSSLPNGSYTWWIQTKNNDGTGPLSSSMTFTVTAYGVVDGGFAHSVAANRDGAPSAWGQNFYGQIGDGSTLDRFTAVGVSGLTGIVDIQAGEFHTVALGNDGRVFSVGYNGQGQLGIGTTADSATAVQVSGITDAVAIAVGRNHTLVLLAGGTVKAFGANGNGQLGDNSTTDRTSPVTVSGLSGAVAIGTGANHSLAVKSDGTAVAFGDNFYGQLGDGTNTDRLTPVSVSTLTGATKAASSASGNHSLFLKSDGTVRSTGHNADGQLGDDSTTDRNTVVSVTGLTGVVALAVGESHSLALKSDNTVTSLGLGGHVAFRVPRRERFGLEVEWDGDRGRSSRNDARVRGRRSSAVRCVIDRKVPEAARIRGVAVRKRNPDWLTSSAEVRERVVPSPSCPSDPRPPRERARRGDRIRGADSGSEGIDGAIVLDRKAIELSGADSLDA